MRTRLLLFAACVALCAVRSVAHATTMLPLTIEQLTERADAVVRAQTLTTTSAWDGHGRIVTRAHVRVVESFAGSRQPGEEFDVASYGGTVDGTSMIVIGAPQFATGEDVVLFVGPQGPLGTGVVELAQGKFEITRDAKGVERLTRRSLEGVDFVHRAAPEPVLNLSLLRFHVARAARTSR